MMTGKYEGGFEPYNFSRSQQTSDTDLFTQDDNIKSTSANKNKVSLSRNLQMKMNTEEIFEQPQENEVISIKNSWSVKFLKTSENVSNSACIKETSLSDASTVMMVSTSEPSENSANVTMNEIKF
jgi:hypothetical protein